MGAETRFHELISQREVFGKVRRLIQIIHSKMRYVMEYDDLFQEVMLRAIKYSNQFQGEEADLLRWCGRIGWNVLIDELRRIRRASHRVREFIEQEQAPVQSDAATTLQNREHLMKTLSVLSPRERSLLELTHLRGLTLAEVGRILGISSAAAKQLHYRALKKLR